MSGDEKNALALRSSTSLAATASRLEEALATDSVEQAEERVAGYMQRGKADSTKRKYDHHFARYAAWCKATQNADPLPATPFRVAAYATILAQAGQKVSTIKQAVSAIASVHRRHGGDWDPRHAALREALGAIRRDVGVRPKQKRPIEELDLRRMVGTCSSTKLIDVRDKALLLVGWFGAFRRSEIVALDVADVTFNADGLSILLRRSKTDQEGAGYEKGIVQQRDHGMCPAVALRAWLDAAAITDGPLFRRLGRGGQLGARLGDQAVAAIVKARVVAAGIDADPALFAGHSLRSGFVTTAARRDKPLDQIMRQTAHKSEETVMGYIRHATIFKKNATEGLM